MARSLRAQCPWPRAVMLCAACVLFVSYARGGLALGMKGKKGTAAHEIALNQFEKDPEAIQDTFLNLGGKHKAKWEQPLSTHYDEYLDFLDNPVIPTVVTVVLVGFNGEGNQKIKINPIELDRYLKLLESVMPIHSLEEEGPSGWASSAMFHVLSMPQHIADEIEGAIRIAIQHSRRTARAEGTGATLRLISHSVVDNIIKREHKQAAMQGLTIYVLNPEAPRQQYAFTYGAAVGGCPGTLWAGEGAYLWLDLSAGPITYGPLGSGRGLVMPHSFPSLSHYGADSVRSGLLADTAAFVRSAVMQLVARPLGMLPGVWIDLDIRIIRIHDAIKSTARMAELDSARIDGVLRKLLLPGQTMTIREEFVGFSDCAMCVAAFTQARKTRTGRVPGPEFRVQAHEFVDSALLLALTEAHGSDIMASAGLGDPPDAGSVVLPVFVFETSSSHVLLFEDGTQATARPSAGMVVALATQAGEAVAPLSCLGSPVLLNPHSLTRPVLASLLTAGWGVAPPEAAPGSDTSYLFSVGNTPFGALAGATGLPFSAREAAQRNVVLAALNGTLTATADLLRGFKKLSTHESGGPTMPSEVLRAGRGRTHALLHKLHSSLSHLGDRSFALALYYAKSAKHDLAALSDVAGLTQQALVPRFSCAVPRHGLAIAIWSAIIAPALVVGALGSACMLITPAIIRAFRPRRPTSQRKRI